MPTDAVGRACSRSSTAGCTATSGGRSPPLRRRALRAAERWIVERQERDGSWGGIQPPWVWSIVALHALGYRSTTRCIARALAGLDSFTIEDEQGRRIEACQSPVWDTALARARAARRRARPRTTTPSRAARSGSPAARFACAATGPCGGRTSRRAASRSSSRTTTTPTSTTRRSSCSRSGARAIDDGGAAERGVAWSLGMQSSDGGWAAFDVDNTSGLPREAAVLRLRRGHRPAERRRHRAHGRDARARGARATSPRRDAGIEWLLREQEPDGSWFGRWGANHVYGTGAVVPALAACGLARPSRASAPRVALARARAERRRRLRRGPALLPRRRLARARRVDRVADGVGAARASTPPASDGTAVERAVRWLVETQRRDGSWDEPYFTGTGFPGDFYFNYHLYRQVFPVMALGRVLGSRRMSDLLVLAPLRLEAAALPNVPGWTVLRTGMGPARARIAAARGLAVDEPAVAIAGVCGAVSPELRAGDVVCATELRRQDGEPITVPSADVLAAAVRRRGLRAHTGPIFCVDKIVGPGRAARARSGRRARRRHGVGLARRGGRRPAARRRARRRRHRRAQRSSTRARWPPGSAPCAPCAERLALAEWTAGSAEVALAGTRPCRLGVRREHPAPPERRRRALPDEAAHERQREVPAARRARAAVPVQSRVLVLREDPVPGAHPQEADARRAGARRDRGVGRADGLDRGRRAARAPRGARDGARS